LIYEQQAIQGCKRVTLGGGNQRYGKWWKFAIALKLTLKMFSQTLMFLLHTMELFLVYCLAKLLKLSDADIPQTTTMTTMAPTVSINTVPVVLVKYNKGKVL